MTNNDVKRLLAPLGIPTAHYQFKGSPRNPAPSPPFMVYFSPQERGYGADDQNLIKWRRVRIELYTEWIDEELENRLEALLSAHEYDKDMTFIEDEELYLTAYEIETYQKIGG